MATTGTATRASKRRRLEDDTASPPTSTSPSSPSSSSAGPSSSSKSAANHRGSEIAAARSGDRQHPCPQCQKMFARHEHMVRHLTASHSSAALYECDECGKSFRRSDVLQRHQRLHQARIERLLDSTDLSQRQQSALARVQAACLQCSSKKLKCDALRPTCSRCARSPIARCEYPRQDSEAPSSAGRGVSRGVRAETSEGGYQHVVSADRSQSVVAHLGGERRERTARFRLGSEERALDFAAGAFIDGSASPGPVPQTALAAPNDGGQTAQDVFDTITGNDAPLSFAAPLAPKPQSSSSLPLADIEASYNSLQDKALDDLLGWLDGPANVDVYHQGQIDWTFGDSPHGSSSLSTNGGGGGGGGRGGWGDEGFFNWDQVKFLADASSQPHSAVAPLLGVNGQGPSRPPRSPLDVLSAAAQLHVHDPRHDSAGHVDCEPPGGGSAAHDGEAQARGGDRYRLEQPRSTGTLDSSIPSDKPAPVGERESRAAVPVDDAVSRHISATGGRSRWNSPEPAEEDGMLHDSEQDGGEAGSAAAPVSQPASSERPAPPSTNGKSRAVLPSQSMWPNRWNPELRETVIPHFTFAKASEEHLMAEDMAHVPPISVAAKERMPEYLRVAAFSLEEKRRISRAFETVNAETLNIYLQLFFYHFYAFFPFIHRATFSPDRCDPRLLAALCSVGAFFSEVPGSRNSGIYLASLAQNSLGQATHLNPELARFTSSFQTFLLVFLIWRSIGAPARQEHAEAFRSTYTTMIRRTRLLEDLAPPELPASAQLEERWLAWIAWEGGRRTAWSVFVSETELTSAWSLPSAFVANEVKGQLPLDDRLWEAPSAVEWAQVAATLAGPRATLPRQLTLSEACHAIAEQAHKSPGVDGGAATSEALARLAQLSPLGRLCVASAMYLSTVHTLQMATFCSSIFESPEATHARIRLVLDSASRLLSSGQDQDIRAEMLLHATQLFHLVPLETLQTLSCRRGPRRMAAARRALAKELRHDSPWKVSSIIRHAGQILRLAKQSLKRTPTEGVYLFYSCVSLHAVSILALQGDGVASSGDVNRQHVVRISMSSGPAGGGRRLTDAMCGPAAWNGEPGAIEPGASLSHCDSSPSASSTRSQVPASTATTSHLDLTTVYILESVGNLAHPLAAGRILQVIARQLRDNDGFGVWPLSRSLAKILDSLASVTSRSSAKHTLDTPLTGISVGPQGIAS